MKGVILSGGTGSRLEPLTKVTNKHLLPVYNKPMIYFPIDTLLKAGINEILIVSGPGHAGHFLNVLGSGKDFNAKFIYEIQDEAGGIAQAIGLAEKFVGEDEKFVVILGDNLFEDDITPFVMEFEKQETGAKIFLKEVPDANRFGVAEVSGDKIVSIEEKPKNPKSSYATVGLYMYPKNVFDIIKKLKPSGRGELEVTDINNAYMKKNELTYNILKGFWSDAGTFQSLLRATKFVASKENKNKPNGNK